MDFYITKVMDGLFIGDQMVATDFEFIFGNKVSHIIGWSLYPLNLNMEDEGVYNLNVQKSIEEATYPTYAEFQRIIDFIQKSKQECLCCLVYSDKQIDAALIIIPYIMVRFKWNLNTSWNFLMRRIEMTNVSPELWEKLLKIQETVIKAHGRLKNIKFNIEALAQQITDDDEQMILINTIKNSLQIPIQISQNTKTKTTKRVQWYDQIRNYTKPKMTYKRPSSSLKKYPKQFNSKLLNKKQVLSKKNNLKISVIPRNFKQQMDEQFLEDEWQVPKQVSLKTMDEVLRTKILKRTSLKQSQSQKSLLNKRGDSAKKSLITINTISANSFLNNLKSLSKPAFKLYA